MPEPFSDLAGLLAGLAAAVESGLPPRRSGNGGICPSYPDTGHDACKLDDPQVRVSTAELPIRASIRRRIEALIAEVAPA